MTTRVFTCNTEYWPYTEVLAHINRAKQQFCRGINFCSTWSCGRIQQIKVGDKAYFYRLGNAPKGFFACGRVIATEKKHQTRLNCSNSQNLSEAYTDEYGDLRISYELYSVVDYDKTLNGELFRKRTYNFLLHQSGERFREEYVGLLNDEWGKYVKTMKQQGYAAYTSLPNT